MNGLEKFDLRTQIIKSLDACKRVIDDPDLSRLMREAKKLDAVIKQRDELEKQLRELQ